MINLCPVGRSCTQEIRDQFSAYDKVCLFGLFCIMGRMANVVYMLLRCLLVYGFNQVLVNQIVGEPFGWCLMTPTKFIL